MKNIFGFVLVDTPHSALNNAGEDAGSRTENTVAVKTIRRGREVYPYISGQALRYWWRTTLADKFDWKMSPVIREKKIAFTEANPIRYGDDDMFGYMRAIKNDTLTRVSPLKCAPLVSVLSQTPVDDFGVMARQEGDPVPYEHQFYSTIMKGIFSLNIDQVGVFSNVNQTGFKNLNDKLEAELEESGATKVENKWTLPKDIRTKRITNTIEALAYIYGGAKHTTHLTDVTPKFVILAMYDGGNHIFMNLAREEKREVKIDFKELERVLTDYSNEIVSDVYIGKSDGFLPELGKEIDDFKNKFSEKTIHTGSPKQVIDLFVKAIPEYIK